MANNWFGCHLGAINNGTCRFGVSQFRRDNKTPRRLSSKTDPFYAALPSFLWSTQTAAVLWPWETRLLPRKALHFTFPVGISLNFLLIKRQGPKSKTCDSQSRCMCPSMPTSLYPPPKSSTGGVPRFPLTSGLPTPGTSTWFSNQITGAAGALTRCQSRWIWWHQWVGHSGRLQPVAISILITSLRVASHSNAEQHRTSGENQRSHRWYRDDSKFKKGATSDKYTASRSGKICRSVITKGCTASVRGNWSLLKPTCRFTCSASLRRRVGFINCQA